MSDRGRPEPADVHGLFCNGPACGDINREGATLLSASPWEVTCPCCLSQLKSAMEDAELVHRSIHDDEDDEGDEEERKSDA